MHLIIPSFLVVAAVYWISTASQGSDPSESITTLADRLYPYAETVQLDEETLWRDAIGGVSGCRGIYHSAVQMVRTLRDLPETAPEVTAAKNEILIKSWVLFWATRRCIYIETPLKSVLPALPRLNAWVIARLYCDMATSYTLALSASVQGELLPVPSGNRT